MVREDRNVRADAQRNRATIMDAALERLADDPRASMADIARAANVGRVTLYGHFSSRAELIDAVFERTMRRAEAELGMLDLDGDPKDALKQLVISSWRIVDEFHGLLGAAEQELGADNVRAHHDRTLSRVHALIERGQADDAFRRDQPAQWLTACFFAILHGAAAEVRAGRMTEDAADRVVPATILTLVGITAATDPVT